MTHNERFVETFWDADYLGTKGFELVCRHMRDGKKVCKDIEDFMKQRSKIDADYGRTLLNLSRKVEFGKETGTLGQSWLLLRLETEKIAQIYENSSLAFSSLARSLSKFNDEQKKKKIQIEDRMRKIQSSHQQLYQKTTNSQKTYFQRCKERDTLNQQLKTARRSVTVPIHELKKIQLKSSKMQELCQICDNVYRNSLQALEKMRQEWEKELESSYEIAQMLEEERIEYVREELWKCTNVSSEACIKHDEHCEVVRLSLEKCDIAEDIMDFINRNKTGKTRPVPLSYQPYGDEGTYDIISNVTTLEDTASSTNQREHYRRLAPLPPTGSLSPPRPDPPNLDVKHVDIDHPGNDTMTHLDNDSQNNWFQRQELKVLKGYTPKNPTELSVKPGEVVELIRKMEHSEMVQIRKFGSNKYGLVPDECFYGISTYL